MCHHLRMDNIEYYRRGSHGLCRIVLLKDQGNVWFFVSLDMFEVYQQVGLFPWTIDDLSMVLGSSSVLL